MSRRRRRSRIRRGRRATSRRGLRAPRRAGRGFTLLELILALGLFSILVLALVQLVDTSLGIWRRTESSRDRTQLASAVLELVARDVRALDPGPRGDLFCDWTRHDLDGDGVAAVSRPRLRLVRELSPRELAWRAGVAPGAGSAAPGRGEMVEVAWAVVPPTGSADPALGTLVRVERPLAVDGASLLATHDLVRELAADELRVVSEGCLWLGVRFASRATVLEDGWGAGAGLADAATSWDAWGRGRADAGGSVFNERTGGAPSDVRERPVLPRRIRLELELEQPSDVKWRTRLARAAEPGDARLVVGDGRRVPRPGAYVLLDEEWMRVTAVDGEDVGVARAQRGTRAVWHDAGALVHHGWPMVREVPLAGTREDWGS